MHISLYIYLSIYLPIYISIYMYIYKYIYTHIHTHIYIYIYINIYIYIHIYKYNIYIYIYIYYIYIYNQRFKNIKFNKRKGTSISFFNLNFDPMPKLKYALQKWHAFIKISPNIMYILKEQYFLIY